MRICRACLVALLLILGLTFGQTGAHADSLGDALTHFTAADYDETNTGILTVASSGNPRAETVLRALQDGQLMFSAEKKAVYIQDASNKLFDAATGQEVPGDPPADLDTVSINNRLRGTIDAALGGLTLLSSDPAARLAAAEAVFKSRDASALPTLNGAIQKEKDQRILRVLMQARAAIILSSDDAKDEDRIADIAIIQQRGDQDALGLLQGLTASNSPPVAKAAASAIASIQGRLAIWNTVQNCWYGISLGSVLLLAAIGLAITFGVMGVINMAHGEMVMIGAYSTFIVQSLIPPQFAQWSLAVAIPIAFVVAGCMGILIERLVIRFLYGRPLETLLATWGVSLILQQLVRTIFGANNRQVSAPAFMSGSIEVGGISITTGRLWIIVLAIAVFVALQLLLRATSFGLRMRAVTQNRRMAAAMGISTGRIDMFAFGLGSGIAGIAGVALSQIDNVSPNLGQGYIIDSFMVVVFGGVGNLWGTTLGALTLGIVNKFLEPIAGAVLGKIIVLVLLILFVQRNPRGMFPLKGRAVEA